MYRKPIIILFALTVFVFGNSLLNGFVGDDNFLIIDNDFYTSWSNAKDLFTSKYLTSSVEALNVQDKSRYFSGSVAYRPVLSLTYFLDYFIWQLKPFGYHLTNLLWHLANVCAVYALVFLITRAGNISFLTALLFAVHPYKSEAVCSIGYRADLVSTFFLLAALVSYILFRSQSKKIMMGSLSLFSFLFAVFTKESVIIFPALLLIYDQWINPGEKRDNFGERLKRYIGYVAICLVYLYVYLIVFPNKTAGSIGWFHGNLLSHVSVCIHIFGDYLSGFFIPMLVKVMPPVYLPQIGQPWGTTTWLILLIIFLSFFLFYKMAAGQKEIKFFAGWFLITLIPVSNIIPLVNPMAHRFMYLPSVGILFILARLILDIGRWLNEKTGARHFIYILALGYIGASGIITVQINAMWRHDYIMAFRLYQNHPNDPSSHLFMGITYQRIGELEKAKEVILKGMRLGLKDPRTYYILGLCTLRELDEGQRYLEEGIRFYPEYAMLHLGLGRIHLLKGDIDKALFQIKKSIELTPSYRGYCYLTQIYLMKGDEPSARKVWEDIKTVLPDQKYHAFILNIIDHKDELDLPQDIGF
ncbi:MAG: hypothetical protein AB7S78_08485 [Candidatus Omnitrophota bacterium]